MVFDNEKKDFWPFDIAKKLTNNWKENNHIICTGTSISGNPHIGNANDVIIGDSIRIALRKIGSSGNLIWIADDMDPFRNVPKNMPNEMEKYLGVPAALIPDFWDDNHNDFIEHFKNDFIEQLEKLKIKPKIMSGIKMYKEGMYNDSIKIVMNKRNEIASILNQYKSKKIIGEWYPINIICEKCNKISTTIIKKYDDVKYKVEYLCDDKNILLNKKNEINGCGYNGIISILNGNAKITWRVEWAARWSFLGTTCEPFGKEHSTYGGSWDTGKEISKKIFNYKPPMPIIYEHFLVNGNKMSKSKGNVITVNDMLKYMLPEHLRYWIFQGRLTIAKNIILKDIVPKLFNDFNNAEMVFINPETENDPKKRNNLISAYELAIGENYINKNNLGNNISFEEIKKNIIENRKFYDDEKLNKKIKLVKAWINDYEKRIFFDEKLQNSEKKSIEEIIKIIKNETDENKIQIGIFETAKNNNIKPMKIFKLIYNILLGYDNGPRLGSYILQIGKENIIKKLEKCL